MTKLSYWHFISPSYCNICWQFRHEYFTVNVSILCQRHFSRSFHFHINHWQWHSSDNMFTLFILYIKQSTLVENGNTEVRTGSATKCVSHVTCTGCFTSLCYWLCSLVTANFVTCYLLLLSLSWLLWFLTKFNTVFVYSVCFGLSLLCLLRRVLLCSNVAFFYLQCTYWRLYLFCSGYFWQCSNTFCLQWDYLYWCLLGYYYLYLILAVHIVSILTVLTTPTFSLPDTDLVSYVFVSLCFQQL
jgi:hypothetical protein